jgi:hypothetical protein
MGGMFGIGGSASKTDRSNQLTSFSGLKNLFNWALPAGQAATGAGQNILSGAASTAQNAGNYFQRLMSGNRTALQGAIAPAANAAQVQADAQRRQLAASGTARGGGVAGVQQQQKETTLAKIQNMLFGARTAGAEGSLQAARTQAGIGGTEAGIGTNLIGSAGTAASNLGELAGSSRQTSLQQDNAAGAAAGQLAMALLFA